MPGVRTAGASPPGFVASGPQSRMRPCHHAHSCVQTWRSQHPNCCATPAIRVWGEVVDAHQTTVKHGLTNFRPKPARLLRFDFPGNPSADPRFRLISMANRDKAPTAPLVLIANDQEWSARSLESILGPQRLCGGAGLHGPAGTGAGADVAARSDHPRRADARHARVRGLPGPAQRSPLQRHDAHRHHHLGSLGPYPATRGVSRPAPGSSSGSRSTARRSCSSSNTFLQCKREVDALREENLLDPGTGLYNMRGLARRAKEIGAEAFRRRDPLACVVFAPEIDETDGRGDAGATRPAGCPTRWACSSGRRAAPPTRSGGWASPSSRVIAPGTGPEAAVRLVRRLGGAVESSPIPVRGGERCVRVRAGYCAVPDFAESSVDAVGAPASGHDGPTGPQARGRGRRADSCLRPGARASTPAEPAGKCRTGTTICGRRHRRVHCGIAACTLLDTRRTLW